MSQNDPTLRQKYEKIQQALNAALQDPTEATVATLHRALDDVGYRAEETGTWLDVAVALADPAYVTGPGPYSKGPINQVPGINMVSCDIFDGEQVRICTLKNSTRNDLHNEAVDLIRELTRPAQLPYGYECVEMPYPIFPEGIHAVQWRGERDTKARFHYGYVDGRKEADRLVQALKARH